MLEEKNGKRIESIKFNKKNIVLTFVDGDSIKISEDTFTHFYLYKDKELSNEEYQEIIDYQNLNSAREYSLNLLSKGYYTEKEVFTRLINKKKLSIKDANIIIGYLKEHCFIDDEKYFSEYVESLHYKNYGKNKIIQKCYDEGLPKKLIETLTFDDEEEINKATIILKKFIATKKYNYQKLKEKGYSFLLNQGFDVEICSYIIKIIDDMYDFSKEEELLHKELRKYLLVHNVDLNNFEVKQKLINSFIRKGYNYEDIKKALKGVDDDEIC